MCLQQRLRYLQTFHLTVGGYKASYMLLEIDPESLIELCSIYSGRIHFYVYVYIYIILGPKLSCYFRLQSGLGLGLPKLLRVFSETTFHGSWFVLFLECIGFWKLLLC